MKIPSIIHRFSTASRVCVLEVNFTGNASHYRYVLMERAGGKVKLNESGDCASLDAFVGINRRQKTPVIVLIAGKGVIVKEISADAGIEDIDEVISRHIPGLKSADFFMQLFQRRNAHSFLACCRKEQVMSILTQLQSAKVEVIEAIIGPGVFCGMGPLFIGKTETVSALHCDISFIDGEANKILSVHDRNQDSDVELAGIRLNSEFLGCFAAGFAFLADYDFVENADGELVGLKKKHFERDRFKRLVAAGVVAIFLITITNALVYSRLYSSNTQLDAELTMYQDKDAVEEKRRSSQAQSIRLVTLTGAQKKSAKSELCDRICSTLPADITLNELSVYPQRNKRNDVDSLPVFDTETVKIAGICKKSHIVNGWISTLQAQPFISEVTLLHFVYDTEGSKSNFELVAKTSDDF